MGTIMKASDFVKKVKDVAENYKTLYVMGCFGAPMTTANKKRYINHHSYNAQESRVKMINAASKDTFGFDCVNLIKGILWGWNGNASKTYGGATYKPKEVADVTADGMIQLCTNVSTDFSKIEVGEAVWSKGHIGVYIGDGLVVESTPAWKNKVQITAVKNIGVRNGYNARNWTKHGKLPYIDYDVKSETVKTPTTPKITSKKTKTDAAEKRDKSLSGTYKVTATALHIRAGAGTNKKSIGGLKKGDVVNNYGYYSEASNGTKWLYIQTADGTVGFSSSKYLKKC